jgi:hypothetical protein
MVMVYKYLFWQDNDGDQEYLAHTEQVRINKLFESIEKQLVEDAKLSITAKDLDTYFESIDVGFTSNDYKMNPRTRKMEYKPIFGRTKQDVMYYIAGDGSLQYRFEDTSDAKGSSYSKANKFADKVLNKVNSTIKRKSKKGFGMEQRQSMPRQKVSFEDL